jgi:hypothetical protein
VLVLISFVTLSRRRSGSGCRLFRSYHGDASLNEKI